MTSDASSILCLLTVCDCENTLLMLEDVQKFASLPHCLGGVRVQICDKRLPVLIQNN